MRRWVGALALRAFGGLVVVWLVAPVLVVIPLALSGQRSFVFPPKSYSWQWFNELFDNPEWRDAMLTSLRIALLVVLASTILGTAAALGLQRSQMRGLAVVRGLLVAPMIVPVVITAVGVYAVFLPRHLLGTELGFVLAHTVLAFPYVVTNVYAGLLQFDPQLERAAHSLGANRIATFFTVTFPIIRPSVLAGFLFAFVISFDEVVIGLFLSDPFTITLPVQMYLSVSEDVDPTVAATASLMLVLTTALVVIGLFAASRAFKKLLNIEEAVER
jgi:putative spermidine/putrescine transport system permease protein